MRLETKYAKSGDVSIAYQVVERAVGTAGIDLVFVMGWVSHLDYFWEELGFARFLRRLASFSRLILFDKRGTGLSDRVALGALPALEQRMDDVRAVLDAAGSRRAALLGVSEGAALCALFAATYPARTAALVAVGGYARRLWAPDYPWGEHREERQRVVKQMAQEWGVDVALARRAPSRAGDARFREWWATYLRMSASPGAAVALSRMNMEVDIRHVLPAIRVPALVIHRTGDRTLPVEGSRYMAAQIPGARYVELPGDDHLPFVGDQDAILDEVELFLTGVRPPPDRDRVLATILAVEVAGATAAAARLGARRWREALEAHQRAVHQELERFRGRVIGATGVGLLASFDGAARAVRCAGALVDAARGLGIKARAGLHTGECDVAGGDVRGTAVDVAAGVLAQAGPGEVFVSGTVKDLVAGSGIAFEEQGLYRWDGELGEAEEWRLFRVERAKRGERGWREGGATAPVAPGVVPAYRRGARLTAREREVAAHLARGLTNRQIAEALVITVATAERHVTNVLNKLGFHSRAQIAAWAAEQGLNRSRFS
jgi:pimeloyl-ACP methyl ester carboxylesterase/class 3 adenylate cyclase/DNA-binding CsgD family transcriptional regulator